MRKILLTMMALIISIEASAEPISRQQAQQRAAAFLKQQNPQATLATTAVANAPRKVKGQTIEDQSYYYVFNTENNHGFVIASGDDVAIPILAYSDEGTFDEENIPDGLQYMLDGYAKEIAWAQENGMTASQTPRKAKSNRQTISHLVSAKWGQSSPYNNQCPKSGFSRCVTGCVATAMAQVMYYWGNQKGNSNMGATAIPAYVTYTDKTNVSALSERTFKWSEMKDAPSSNNASEIAYLMRYCGQSVEMDYTTSESGAYNYDVPFALKNYFMFSKAARYVEKYNYTDEEWDEIIYSELAAGRPVIYGGIDSNNGGHCFVCDGYDSTTEKYYFNWGWTGTGNSTLCALSALNVSDGSNNYQFNYSQDAIINIKPNTQETTEEEIALVSNLNLESLVLVSDGTLKREVRSEDSPKIEIMGLVSNYSGLDLELETAFVVLNENNDTIGIIETEGEYSEAKTQYGYYLKNLTFGAEMPYGKYKLYPTCRPEGSSEWNKMNGVDDKYLQVKLANNGTDIVIKPAFGISVEDVSQTSSGSGYNKKYTTTVKFKNIGCETYSGYVYVVADIGTSSQSVSYAVINNLAPDSETSQTVTYNYDINNTAHSLFITADGLLPIYYSAAEANLALWNLYWLNSVGENQLIGDKYECVGQFFNNGDKDYTGTVTGTIYEKGTASSTGQTKSFEVNVKPGQIYECDFSFGNVDYDKTYCMKLVYNGITYYLGDEGTSSQTNNIYYLSDYAFTMAKGLSIFSEDNGLQRVLDSEELPSIPETAYYVDARYSDKAASIGEGGRTNTVYLLKEGTTIPEALSGKNVVVGSAAENITISDDEEFYTPADFTAANVTYKRTFYKGCDADSAHWTTIMLPFKVESITCNDQTLDWYRSAEDQDKNFWLMDFTGETDGKANFSYAESIEANHPYIITVPSNAWGQKWNLVDKEIAFSGQNAEFKADMPTGVVNRGGKYDFIGRTYLTGQVDKYCMNDEGTEFEYVSDGWMFYAFPFSGYFVAYYDLGEESNIELDMPAPLPTAIATLIGDVNKDGTINVADITALTNILVNGDEANVFDHAAADINQVDGLTKADVTALVDLILEKAPQRATPKRITARKGQRVQKMQMKQGLTKSLPTINKKIVEKLNRTQTFQPVTLLKK